MLCYQLFQSMLYYYWHCKTSFSYLREVNNTEIDVNYSALLKCKLKIKLYLVT